MMRYLLSSALLFHLFTLCVTVSDRVVVQPSSDDNPESRPVAWPESTNKVAITVQCPDHKVKLSIWMPDHSAQGSVSVFGRYAPYIRVYCRYAGRKNWYEGELWKHPAGTSGPCMGNVGTTDMLIVKWTQEEVKLMRNKEVIVHQMWGPTDGNCLKKSAFWRIQNYGTTVTEAESVSGTT